MDAEAKIKAAQSAAREAEKRMIAFLIKSDVLDAVSLSVIKQIADETRSIAFDATEAFRLHI
jgi:hypothetical protein